MNLVRVLLFTSDPDGSGGFVNVQKVTTDLIMHGDCYNGPTADSADDVVIAYLRPIAHGGAVAAS